MRLVFMTKNIITAATHLDPIDQTGVIQFITEDHIARTDQSPDDADIGMVARTKDQSRFGSLPIRKSNLEGLMRLHMTTDQGRSTRTGAAGLERFDTARHNARVSRQSEIIIRSQA